ncbi:DUF6602 domain-containing protein [Isoptericola dokdonensis]|uniref:DUF6602 domain-containing protein n=1 Tax=Isoptericola dokdonensis DS-3 TaxID=1300344 RepID=A0A168E7T8_9MICO|nr:DUF6602 domain-containing protein [Isoptericola dokdonensis]ANC29702.1 hypothetical protein I598_0109 [Isoptericola dokdonensis DS-3]
MAEPFDLGKAFGAKQEHMLTGLGLMPSFTDHPTSKGDATEGQWITVLQEFLPRRYGVGRVFAIDSRGGQSQQIDLAIYDQQYSPLFFEQEGLRFVPVESIYAVFEVKPTLNKAYVEYARTKIASVRSLHRTTVPIRHAGGEYPAQDPASKPIIGGILATDSEWTDLSSAAARDAILAGDAAESLDFAIAVRHSAAERVQGELHFAPTGQHLIWFAVQLFQRLAKIGTVLALDLDAYAIPIRSGQDIAVSDDIGPA